MVERKPKIPSVDLDQKFYTIKEVADALQVTRTTVQNWIHKEELKAYALGSNQGRRGPMYRIAESDLQEFISRNAQN